MSQTIARAVVVSCFITIFMMICAVLCEVRASTCSQIRDPDKRHHCQALDRGHSGPCAQIRNADDRRVCKRNVERTRY